MGWRKRKSESLVFGQVKVSRLIRAPDAGETELRTFYPQDDDMQRACALTVR